MIILNINGKYENIFKGQTVKSWKTEVDDLIRMKSHRKDLFLYNFFDGLTRFLRWRLSQNK